ncbi:hypothetical protein PACTADRAFT_50899 [Pachysolen tannophilus NRRL Y-2460]|uniref:Major facilitator superfamily (MFS) profile domain-containing protein n=1 Tax=Pachysolen tannophilus NRRL Y-2460 TaxID=669874 RepID=A0A1E4TTR8_PACTA|nr:hypothetical protein PACTADRAFT_50899 [Pachysolen tannophilus NRRL Y-2460]
MSSSAEDIIISANDEVSKPVDEKKPTLLIPATETSAGEDRIKQYLPKYDRFWMRTPHFLKLNALMVVVSLSSTNTGYDGSLLNSLQTFDEWVSYMGNPDGAVLGALNNGVVFGVVLSFFCASYISDKYGRRNTIAFGNIFMLIGVIIQSCSINYGQFLVSRMIIGFGNGIAIVPSPTLISELTYPTHRQIVTTFYNSCWYLGAIVAAWVSFGSRNVTHNWCWRIPSIVQGFFPLVQTLFIYFVPESPRFLVNKGRYDEAREILLKYHAGGDEQLGGALVDFEMAEIQSAIELEKIAARSKYSDFFKTPGNRKRFFLLTWIAIMMQLSGNGLVSYYLNKVLNSIGMTSTDEKLIVNGGLMIYNFGISMIIAFFVNFFKRRTMFLFSNVTMLIVYVIWTILSAINQERDFADKSLAQGVLAMIFFYYLAYNVGLNGLPYLYLTEILPFTLRTKGINSCLFIQQFVQIYNGFVNSIAMDAIEWKYYIVYCCILAVELVVVYFTFVETSGRTLEEVAEVFGEQPQELSKDFDTLKGTDEQIENKDTASSDSQDNVIVV